MDGRLENEMKIFSKIEQELRDEPECIKKWFLYLRANQTTAASCSDYLRKVRRFINSVNKKVKDITLEDCQQYYISIQTKTSADGTQTYTSDSYRISVWSALNNFFNFLWDTGEITDNPMRHIQKGKNDDLNRINKTRILLTERDFKKIMDCVKKSDNVRDVCIVYLFMTTGMRRTALTEINLESIDYEKMTLTITDKGDKEQVYPLEESFISFLGHWLQERNKILEDTNRTTNALFISRYGDRLTANSVYKIIEKYSTMALGYGISPHKLRSGLCSILFNKTKDIETVRRVVGHSNIATTQRYIVTENTERKNAAQYITKSIKLEETNDGLFKNT